jgi:hypothetical protein
MASVTSEGLRTQHQKPVGLKQTPTLNLPKNPSYLSPRTS